jgi:phosphopentomutase
LKKAILIVLDSFGIGALPDAEAFGDTGADTLGHITQYTSLNIPNMLNLGLGNIQGVHAPGKSEKPLACFGKCAERQMGKDTTGGHWEMAGLILAKPFPYFHEGFPKEIVNAFRNRTGLEILGNIAASGTQIIQELGDEHVKTGKPIVYTSADSVMQIAAHEEVIPISKLYEICHIAREIMQGEYAVGRIIARPFIGTSANYRRTENRRDFSLLPPGKTILDSLSEKGLTVAGIGKIEDIFARQGLTRIDHAKNNAGDIEATFKMMQQDFEGLIFTNLTDFDMLYGHRNDIEGYARALEAFDAVIPHLISLLNEEDMLIITADHGCDPSTPGTDHTREYIPLLIYGQKFKQAVDLGIRSTFADIGASIIDYFGLPAWPVGTSFMQQVAGGIKNDASKN